MARGTVVYLDASAVLRRSLGQPDAIDDDTWYGIDRAVTSDLLEVECLRTLDRLHLANQLNEEQLATHRALIFDLMEAIDRAAITRPILRRAAEPFPTALGTLDAIHLATALRWQQHLDDTITVATHDRALALAARACGMDVIGE